jgi:hypothetical protein
MLNREFDSIQSLGAVTFGTTKREYPVNFSPFYISKRVFVLDMEFEDSIYQTAPVDILLSYKSMYGEPDSDSTWETTSQFPSKDDPEKKEAIIFNSTYTKWSFQLYDIIIYTNLTDMKSGGLKGKVFISFKGNFLYYSLLKKLEQNEQN